MHGSRLDSERKPSLTRSQTDSNITYASDEIPEAPGSCCYITKEGDIDLQVVLKVELLFRFHFQIIILEIIFYKFVIVPVGRALGRLAGQQLLHVEGVREYFKPGRAFDRYGRDEAVSSRRNYWQHSR